MKDNMRTKVASNFGWRFLERFGAEGVGLVVSIILARLLDPSVYGTVALVSVIITLLQVFIDSGLGSALVQKKDADNLDFSTVFFFNIIMCSTLYILLFICAPLVARFYNLEELTSIVRALGLSLIISGVKNVQQSYVTRKLIFRKFFFATLGGTIGAAIIGIFLAYNGFGVWALVVQYLFNNLIDTIILWFTVKWRPTLSFSFDRLKNLLSFGIKILSTSLLTTIYNSLRKICIGKVYTKTDLAYYNKGEEFPNKIISFVTASIDNVLFSSMSKVQDNMEALRQVTRRSVRILNFVIWPTMVGLAACGEPLIRLVLTEKWIPSLFFLYLFCFEYTIFPVSTLYNISIKSIGKPGVNLKIIIANRLFGIITLLLFMKNGVLWIAITSIITRLFELLMSAQVNRKYLHYSLLDQIKDLVPPIIISLIMGFAVWCIKYLRFSDPITLLLQVFAGILIYVLICYFVKLDSFEYVLGVIKDFYATRKVDSK